MDLAKRADKLGLNESELKEIMRLFVKTSLADLTEYKAAEETNDFHKAFTAMHSIKGAASSLGFHDISKIALKIEIQARQQNFENSSSAAETLMQKIHRLATVIES